jgi:hypothetical protein
MGIGGGAGGQAKAPIMATQAAVLLIMVDFLSGTRSDS